MTLMLTHLSKFGMIHASDSNLTSDANSSAGQGQKPFKVDYLGAGLTVAGAYSVAGKAMDVWIKDFIRSQASSGAKTLSQFAEALRARLEAEMRPEERRDGSMVHVAGYVEGIGTQHPEFYYVRNVYGIDQGTGEHFDVRDQFVLGEDFWTRDCQRSSLMAEFQSGRYLIYVNGFSSGRIGYIALQNRLTSFFSEVWAQPNWKFRPPRSLAETVLFVSST